MAEGGWLSSGGMVLVELLICERGKGGACVKTKCSDIIFGRKLRGKGRTVIVEHHVAAILLVAVLVIVLWRPTVEEGAVLAAFDSRLGRRGGSCWGGRLEEVVDVLEPIGVALREVLDNARFPVKRRISGKARGGGRKRAYLPRSSPNMYRSGLSARFSRPAPLTGAFFLALCFAFAAGAGCSYMSSSESSSSPLIARSKNSSARS